MGLGVFRIWGSMPRALGPPSPGGKDTSKLACLRKGFQAKGPAKSVRFRVYGLGFRVTGWGLGLGV